MKVQAGQIIYLVEKEKAQKKKKMIGCTLPDINTQLKAGDRVLIDDGLIEAKVIGVRKEKVELQVLRVSAKKPFIRFEKGLNFFKYSTFHSIINRV